MLSDSCEGGEPRGAPSSTHSGRHKEGLSVSLSVSGLDTPMTHRIAHGLSSHDPRSSKRAEKPRVTHGFRAGWGGVTIKVKRTGEAEGYLHSHRI